MDPVAVLWPGFYLNLVPVSLLTMARRQPSINIVGIQMLMCVYTCVSGAYELGSKLTWQVIFLDQPLSTGFSYSTDGSIINNTPDAAQDGWAFLQLFFKQYPQVCGILRLNWPLSVVFCSTLNYPSSLLDNLTVCDIGQFFKTLSPSLHLSRWNIRTALCFNYP